MNRSIADLRGDMNRDIAELRGKASLVQWMPDAAIAADLALLRKAFA